MKKDIFKLTLVNIGKDKAFIEINATDKPEELAMSLSALYAHLKKVGLEKTWDLVKKDSEKIDYVSEVKNLPNEQP